MENIPSLLLYILRYNTVFVENRFSRVRSLQKLNSFVHSGPIDGFFAVTFIVFLFAKTPPAHILAYHVQSWWCLSFHNQGQLRGFPQAFNWNINGTCQRPWMIPFSLLSCGLWLMTWTTGYSNQERRKIIIVIIKRENARMAAGVQVIIPRINILFIRTYLYMG